MEETYIRSRACPDCYVCGTPGEVLHASTVDRLFDAPGHWSFKRCPNTKCALVWLDPMPLEEDINKAYRGYSTHMPNPPQRNNAARRLYRIMSDGYLAASYKYRSVGESGWARLLGYLIYLNPIRRANVGGSVSYLRSMENGRLLDVGCGNGAMLESLEALGWEVEGVDFDSLAVGCARKKGLRVHLGTLAAQGLPPGSFDAVISSHVIEHVPDPLGLLRECHRILKPGGQLIFITPNAGGWGHRLYGPDWRGLEPPRHLHIFTLESLAAIATAAGFTISNCRSIVRANGILLASRMLRRTGRADLTSKGSFALRLWAEAAGLAQWAGLIGDRKAGEELLLSSIK